MNVLKALLGTVLLFGVVALLTWISTLGTLGGIVVLVLLFVMLFLTILNDLS